MNTATGSSAALRMEASPPPDLGTPIAKQIGGMTAPNKASRNPHNNNPSPKVPFEKNFGGYTNMIMTAEIKIMIVLLVMGAT